MKHNATKMSLTGGFSRRSLPRVTGPPRPCRGHESPVTFLQVAALPPRCYDLVFHDPC
jgi:hypothetical protein